MVHSVCDVNPCHHNSQIKAHVKQGSDWPPDHRVRGLATIGWLVGGYGSCHECEMSSEVTQLAEPSLQLALVYWSRQGTPLQKGSGKGPFGQRGGPQTNSWQLVQRNQHQQQVLHVQLHYEKGQLVQPVR